MGMLPWARVPVLKIVLQMLGLVKQEPESFEMLALDSLIC